MTLVLTVNGPETIFLMADRRLSENGKPMREDACKVMCLETPDGTAILGYAGLGATGLGTQPADWMSAVLRGRNLKLEDSLGTLSEAIKKELPRHLAQLPGNSAPLHVVVATAFVGSEARLYEIDIVFNPDRKGHRFGYTRHTKNPTTMEPPRIFIGGSGALHLVKNKNWKRELLRILKAHDRGLISPETVSDHLAILNQEVHLGMKDNSVGARCIVVYRHGKGTGGGGHFFYTDAVRDRDSPCLPTISHGLDIQAITGAFVPHFMDMLKAGQAGDAGVEMDHDEINSELAKLPEGPDEKLR